VKKPPRSLLGVLIAIASFILTIIGLASIPGDYATWQEFLARIGVVLTRIIHQPKALSLGGA
jgi:hypothetical protein